MAGYESNGRWGMGWGAKGLGVGGHFAEAEVDYLDLEGLAKVLQRAIEGSATERRTSASCTTGHAVEWQAPGSKAKGRRARDGQVGIGTRYALARDVSCRRGLEGAGGNGLGRTGLLSSRKFSGLMSLPRHGSGHGSCHGSGLGICHGSCHGRCHRSCRGSCR
jgi:hypothetical protein